MTIRDIAIAFGYKVDESSERNVNSSIENLKSKATKLLGAIGITVSIAGIAAGIKDCVAMASNVEEMENKFNVVFQGINEEVDEWAQNYADAIGRNKNDIKTYLADQQNLLVGFGMTREAGAELSKQMTTLALDLASFSNIDEATAVNAMTKAVMGESEAAKTLGAVLNDTTREQAMLEMGLSGTYNELDQLTKMQVNYNAILSQSPDAIGDCERSLGSYASTMKQFHAKLDEVKTIIGQFFMPVMGKLISYGTQALTVLRDWVQRLSDFVNKIGGAERVLSLLGVTLAAVALVMNATKIMNFVTQVLTMAKSFDLAKLKVIAFMAIFIIIALLIEDFIAFMRGDNSIIGEIFKRAGIDADEARAKILNAWNAVKTFLLNVWDTIKEAGRMFVESIQQWFEEHGQRIRAIFERAWGIVRDLVTGIWTVISQVAATIFGDTENSIDGSTQSTRDKVLTTWQAILDGLGSIFSFLFTLAEAVFNAMATVIETVFAALQVFWETWGTQILNLFSVVWNSIGTILFAFLDILTGVANFISAVFTGDWQGAWDAILQIFTGIWNALVAFLQAGWAAVQLLFQMALTAIQTVWNAVWTAISTFFQGLWNGIVSFFQGIWNSIVAFVTGAINSVYNTIVSVLNSVSSFWTGIWNSVSSFTTGIFSSILSGITSTVSSIASAVQNGLQTAIDWIKSLPAQAVAWGADIINGIASGIQSAIGSVVSAVSGVADKIKSFLHFSEPDEGPLSDFHTYMPDMINTMAEGITNGKQRVNAATGIIAGAMSDGMNEAGQGSGENFISKAGNALRAFAGGASALASASRASGVTASTVGGNDNSSRSIVQNVNISNQFNGDRAGQQRSSEAMDKASDDATSQMARALAFAR